MPDFPIKPPRRNAPGVDLLAPLFAPPDVKKNPPVIAPDAFADVSRIALRGVEHHAGEVFTFVFGGSAPGQKYKGEGAVGKKILEDTIGLLIPGRFVKAIFEIGEGEIPLTEKAGGPAGLGHYEQAYIDQQRAELAVKIAAELRAAELFPRAVALGAFAATRDRRARYNVVMRTLDASRAVVRVYDPLLIDAILAALPPDP